MDRKKIEHLVDRLIAACGGDAWCGSPEDAKRVLLDYIGKEVKCPSCNTEGAREFIEEGACITLCKTCNVRMGYALVQQPHPPAICTGPCCLPHKPMWAAGHAEGPSWGEPLTWADPLWKSKADKRQVALTWLDSITPPEGFPTSILATTEPAHDEMCASLASMWWPCDCAARWR